MRVTGLAFVLQPAFRLSRLPSGPLAPFLPVSTPKCRALPPRHRRPRVVAAGRSAAWQHIAHEPSPLTASEVEHLRSAPAPFAKADINSMTPREREALRVRSRSIPLVLSHAPLDIVYEDDVFLVVSKPSWLKMHPIHRFQGATLLNRVLGYLGQNAHMCHRLDMHTSGVCMFLKTKEYCATIAEAFRDKRVSKTYLCVVDVVGSPAKEPGILPSFTVDAPIERHPTIGILRQIGDSSLKSKTAVTDFECVSRSADGKLALLSVSPRTGRTHQIRIHAREAGFPIVGDDIYGRERVCYDSIEHVRACAQDPADSLFLDGNPLRAGLKLHAWQVSVDHPATGEPITFSAPPPLRFRQLLDAYGLTIPASEIPA